MGKIMTDNVTVIRYNDRLKQTDDKLRHLTDRRRVTLVVNGRQVVLTLGSQTG